MPGQSESLGVPSALRKGLSVICGVDKEVTIAQMLHPDVRDDLPPSECAPASSGKPKQSYGNDESRAASNAISVSPT